MAPVGDRAWRNRDIEFLRYARNPCRAHWMQSSVVAVFGIAFAPMDIPHPTPRAVEVTSALSVGGGVRVSDLPPGVTGVFSLSLRADVLFARSSPRAFGIGPFLSVRTDNFTDIAPTVGASLLVPVTEAFPLVLSAGGAMRFDAAGFAPGVVERLFFGARSYNYQFAYTLAVGLFVESRQFVEPSHTVDVIGGIDVDLEVFVIPFVALYTWIFRRDPGR
jgi:hypothetical protein